MMEASTSSNKICEICGSKSDGLHYGKQCCRACGAFFCRTIRLKLKHKCKKNNTCSIARNLLKRNITLCNIIYVIRRFSDTRVMCRSCRYKKCIENRVLISSVNEPFDSIGKRTISENIIQRSPSNQNTSNTLLEIINGYRNFLYLRKASTAFTSFGNKNTRNMGCATSSYETSKKQCCIESSLIKDILINFFHPNSTVNETDQITLFDKFCSRFLNVERAFNTYRKFGSNEGNQNMIMPGGNYININELV